MLYSPTVFFIEFIRHMLNKKNSSHEYSISKVYLTFIWVSVGIRKLRVHVFWTRAQAKRNFWIRTRSGLDRFRPGLDTFRTGLYLDSTDSDPDLTWTRQIQIRTRPGLNRFNSGPDLDSTDSDPDLTDSNPDPAKSITFVIEGVIS